MCEQMRPRTAGRMVDWRASLRGRYPCIDYTAQEMTIGAFRFLCIDMGFCVPLSTAMRIALGEPGHVERNQCVFLHLSLGLEWITQG